jgi:hypothetical protein
MTPKMPKPLPRPMRMPIRMKKHLNRKLYCSELKTLSRWPIKTV